MSKRLCLCDYNGSGLAAESPPVHVIGCCSEDKHYLRSVEPVKCAVCALMWRVLSALWVMCLTVCICRLMLVLSDFKLRPLFYLNVHKDCFIRLFFR